MIYESGAEMGGAANEYRYRLWRIWGPGRPLPIIMLNPSTADAQTDDATIRKCVGFARRLGYHGIDVANLFAYRTPAPSELAALVREVPALAVGPSNDSKLADFLKHYGPPPKGRLDVRPVVAAWGALAQVFQSRANQVLATYRTYDWRAFELTAKGHPRHPSRLGYVFRLREFDHLGYSLGGPP